MSVVISVIGMLIALICLALLVMKGYNIYVIAISMSLLVAITGGIGLYSALKENYMTGFVGFVKSNFLIFLAGALMGKVYEITGGAKAVARAMVRLFGTQNAPLAVVLATGILTYGGISGFVVCFSVFPIALEIYRAADIPRRFTPGTIIYGCCTFSAIAPGNPQVGQVVLVNALGTTLMSGAVIGFVATGVTLLIGILWLNAMVKKAKANGEHFMAKPMDNFQDDAVLPNAWLALFPLILTLVAINIKINGSSLVPVEYGVALGAALAFLVMRKYRTDSLPIMQHVGDGVKNSITAVCNTSSVVGFGSVVKAAVGFPAVISAMTSMPGPDLIAVALATTVIAGVCGSGSGGLGIAAPILAPIYTARGVTLAELHRTMLVASSGLDTLPHNGFVVTVINGVANETHKDAYMPVFWLTVVIPLISTAVTVLGFTLFPYLP
ncbi:GntP family permease [Caproiciproducens sp. NJN-50]|uniref:GntP family permease n=1 Tax=Acutalibacteraceae TaxID=3082771 RepID=UPI000FFE25C5|nr:MULTISPECIES: GntP family permease [Acutalibacteraceae]QAT49095.1 GntP family permease [Caproiciproducens sp. NJN-50]